MKFNRTTVLILSSDPAFSRALTEHWPKSADTPEFVVLGDDLCQELCGDSYDLAIAEAASAEKHTSLKRALALAGKPAIMLHPAVHTDQSANSHQVSGLIIELRRDPGVWPAIPLLLGREILRRSSAENRARESDRARAAAEAEATLGRYMSEMRTTVNNALTSVLGNVELLLLEPGLPASVLAEADTIRNMSLRLHEVFQRFSSIEKELSVVARESGKGEARAAAVGR